MKRIVVTGSAGGLGSYVLQALEGRAKVGAGTRDTLDVCRPEQVEAVLRHDRVDVVVHLAAVANVATCEALPFLASVVNATGTANVARACRATGARLIYMSTDGVFSGPGPHEATEVPTPASVYGWSKFAGEQAVAALGDAGLIVRAHFFTMHCRSKRSFARYVLEEVGAGRPIDCAVNVFSSPVFAATLAGDIAAAALDDGAKGILHVASFGEVSRRQLACMLCEEYGLPTDGIREVAAASGANTRLNTNGSSTRMVRDEVRSMVAAEPLHWPVINRVRDR